jgi:fructokinase
MSSPDFLGLGELLWDCFPDRRLPGGAPANVAFHAQQLGLAAATVTRVGRDSLGEEICEFLRAQGLSIDLVQRDPVHGTGTVTVTPSATGAGYVFKPDSAWDFLEAQPELIAAMRSARAVCFGTLAQRSPVGRETIHSCLTAASPDCVIVYDVNLRPPFFEREWIERSFRRARIIKLNDDEVRILSEMFATGSDDDVDYARQLLATYSQIELVCVTRGSNGCLAVSRSVSSTPLERAMPSPPPSFIRNSPAGRCVRRPSSPTGSVRSSPAAPARCPFFAKKSPRCGENLHGIFPGDKLAMQAARVEIPAPWASREGGDCNSRRRPYSFFSTPS